MKHHYTNKQGFTLAEVLITLGIIGVVAAMTLPSLINNYKAKVLENQFKKSNSVLQQALKNSVFEMGYGDVSELTIPYGQVTSENFASLKEEVDRLNEVWINQFVGAKKLDYISTYQQFNAKKLDCYSIVGKSQNGIGCFFYAGGDGSYILPDGMLVSKLTAYNNGATLPGCITFSFDTNGPYKGPNRWGHDIFIYVSTPTPYFTECNPVKGTSYREKGCYSWANRNVNPIDNSKSYWDMLFKPESYFE